MSDRNRITTIDALRGFALFGILQVNVLAFSSVFYGTGLVAGLERPASDRILAFFISAFFELKFYLLFSFLFGYSVTLQMQSAGKAGASFVPPMLRRQAGLFVIGMIHAVVLFHGDILTTYAVLGLLLLAVRNWRDNVKLGAAAALFAGTAAFWFLLAVLQWTGQGGDNGTEGLQEAQAALAAYRGTPLSVMARHVTDVGSFLPVLLLLQAPCAFAMFLIGFIAGRRRLLETPGLYQEHLPRIVRWGLLIGMPGGLIYAGTVQSAPGTFLETAGLALSIITSPFLSMAVGAIMLRLFESGRAAGWSRYLASAGRMALSNYLMQSAICAWIFHGYGLGLIGRLSLTLTAALAAAIFGMQLLASHWWLRRFRYGPLEWLLRALTTGEWPRWRRD